MTNESEEQCSRCGTVKALDTRLVACVATSHWWKNNYPAPNTEVTTNDGMEIWRVAVCASCLPAGYKIYLQDRLRKSAELAVICVFALLIGIAGVYFMSTRSPSGVHILPLEYLLAGAVSLAVIGGAIGTPAFLISALVYRIRLGNFDHTGIVPAKRSAACFIGEGIRISRELESSKDDAAQNVYGSFPLPQYKAFEELQMTPGEKAKLGKKPRRERSIIAVGRTLEELECNLPREWKSFWEKTDGSEEPRGREQELARLPVIQPTFVRKKRWTVHLTAEQAVFCEVGGNKRVRLSRQEALGAFEHAYNRVEIRCVKGNYKFVFDDPEAEAFLQWRKGRLDEYQGQNRMALR